MPYRYTLTRDFLTRHDHDLLNVVRFELVTPGCIHPVVEYIDSMEPKHGYIFFVYQLLPVGAGHPHIFEAVTDRTPALQDARLPFQGITECKVLNVTLASVSMLHSRLSRTSFIVHNTEFFHRIHPDEMEGRLSPCNKFIPVFMRQSLVGLHEEEPTRRDARRFRKQEKEIMRQFLGDVYRGIHIHLDDKDLYIFHHMKDNPEYMSDEEGHSDMKEETYESTEMEDPLTGLMQRLSLTEKEKKGYENKPRERRNRDKTPPRESRLTSPSKNRRKRKRSYSGSASD